MMSPQPLISPQTPGINSQAEKTNVDATASIIARCLTMLSVLHLFLLLCARTVPR